MDEKERKELAENICIACGKCKTLKADCAFCKNLACVLDGAGYRKAEKE